MDVSKCLVEIESLTMSNKRQKLCHFEIKIDRLENICLKKIADKFLYFRYIIEKSADKGLPYYFRFLQRTYSFELATELCNKNFTWEDYKDFVVNDYLKGFDGKWLLRSFWESKNNLINGALCHLPNLKSIVIPKMCTDEILENVAKFCPKIVELDIRNSNVTDTGIKFLCKNENGQVPCPKIKHLLIEKTYVTNEGLMCLIKNLPELETIDSPNIIEILYSLYEDGFIRKYNFVDIDIVKYDKELNADLLKVCCTLCPRLESLACCIVTEVQLDAIAKDLKRLHFKFRKSGRNINVNPFLKSKGKNLSCLSIYNGAMSISILARCCSKLKQLCIGNVTFLDEDVNSPVTFNYLAEIHFKYVKGDENVMSDEESSMNKAISFLLASENLESISFSFCDMSSTMKNLILKCCKNNKIKRVSFERIIVQGSFMMDILSNCPTLTNLNIKVCDLLGFQKALLHSLAETLPNKPTVTPLRL